MLGHRHSGAIWAALALIALLAAAVLAPTAIAKKGKPHKGAPTLEFRGQAIIPTGTTFEGTTVGGLSSITYDRAARRLLRRSPTIRPAAARFYTRRARSARRRAWPTATSVQGRHDAARPRTASRTRPTASIPKGSR